MTSSKSVNFASGEARRKSGTSDAGSQIRHPANMAQKKNKQKAGNPFAAGGEGGLSTSGGRGW